MPRKEQGGDMTRDIAQISSNTDKSTKSDDDGFVVVAGAGGKVKIQITHHWKTLLPRRHQA